MPEKPSIRRAELNDLPALRHFTDFWLAGRGLRVKAPGAVNDCFISPSQHKKYVTKYETWVMTLNKCIVAWAVIQNDRSLIHFLVSGYHRRQGLGKKLLAKLDPPKIHSKSDQSSGDPAEFYKHMGYTKTETRKSHSRLDIDTLRPDRKPNIDIFERDSSNADTIPQTICG